MNDLLIRQIAEQCAPRLSVAVESAVQEIIRQQLPGAIAAVLRESFAGEQLRVYVPKMPRASRRERDALILARRGSHPKEVAREAGCSVRQVYAVWGSHER